MENIYEICFYGGLILAILFFIVSIILFAVLKIPKVFGELTGRAEKKSIKERKEGGKADVNVGKKEQAKYYNQNTGKIRVRDTIEGVASKSQRGDTTDQLKQEGVYASPHNTGGFDATATDVLPNGGTVPGPDTEVLGATGQVAGDMPTEVLGAGGQAYGEAPTDILTENATMQVQQVAQPVGEAPTDILSGTQATGDMQTNMQSTDMIDNDAETNVLRMDGIEEGDATTVLSARRVNNLSSKVKVLCNVVVTHTDERL